MSYPVTPTLSVEGSHRSWMVVEVTATTVRFDGVLGDWVSTLADRGAARADEAVVAASAGTARTVALASATISGTSLLNSMRTAQHTYISIFLTNYSRALPRVRTAYGNSCVSLPPAAVATMVIDLRQ